MTDMITGLLERAREHITRHSPAQAAEAMRNGAVLVDLRPTEYRWRFGEIPGAIAVSRHVLEWRMDLTSPHRIKELRAGDYDQEIFLAIHHWQPRLMMMGAPMNANDVAYKYASFNDKLFSAAEPIRVRQGQRILFRFLNASATQNVTLALPGHQFTVIAMDGNPVPQPHSVETLTLGVAERIDAVIEMNSPGIWVLGSTDANERAMGLGRTIEYASKTGKPLWVQPESITWDYFRFCNESKASDPDVRISLVFAPLAAAADGMQHWTINGKEYPDCPPLSIQNGKRHRLTFVNSSAEMHPLHLHRHSFELVSLGGKHGSGLIKDVVNIPPHSTMEVDFLANNPGDTLFHCHQQLHMDYGFMQLFKYI